MEAPRKRGGRRPKQAKGNSLIGGAGCLGGQGLEGNGAVHNLAQIVSEALRAFENCPGILSVHDDAEVLIQLREE